MSIHQTPRRVSPGRCSCVREVVVKSRHRAAIELLLSHPDTTVAEMLGIRLATLRAWMQIDGFSEALRAREREQQAGARRIARQAVISSAAKLCELASDSSKPDPKVLLDILKASGAFEAQPEDPGAALAEIIKLARKDAEASNATSQ